MDDEPPRSRSEYPLSSGKLSKTPSWVMLGFILGAAFVLALPPLRKPVAPALQPPSPDNVPTIRPASDKRAPAKPPELTTIEDVFIVWAEYAVWARDTTEVALWNSETRSFAQLYEVRRIDGAFFFRSIPSLTRRLLTHDLPPTRCPLQFTETEEQYREWLALGRPARVLSPPDETFRPANAPASHPPAVKLERVIPPLETPPPAAPAARK